MKFVYCNEIVNSFIDPQKKKSLSSSSLDSIWNLSFSSSLESLIPSHDSLLSSVLQRWSKKHTHTHTQTPDEIVFPFPKPASPVSSKPRSDMVTTKKQRCQAVPTGFVSPMQASTF